MRDSVCCAMPFSPRTGKGSAGRAQGARVFALDFDTGADSEQPVVEVADHSVDRVGSSFLRFVSACLGEIAMGEDADALDDSLDSSLGLAA